MKRLKYKDNWSYDEYYVDKKMIDPHLIEYVIIENNTYKTKAESTTVQYNDMWNRYHATSTHLFIVLEEAFGEVEVDLNTIIRKNKVYCEIKNENNKKQNAS